MSNATWTHSNSYTKACKRKQHSNDKSLPSPPKWSTKRTKRECWPGTNEARTQNICTRKFSPQHVNYRIKSKEARNEEQERRKDMSTKQTGLAASLTQTCSHKPTQSIHNASCYHISSDDTNLDRQCILQARDHAIDTQKTTAGNLWQCGTSILDWKKPSTQFRTGLGWRSFCWKRENKKRHHVWQQSDQNHVTRPLELNPLPR